VHNLLRVHESNSFEKLDNNVLYLAFFHNLLRVYMSSKFSSRNKFSNDINLFFALEQFINSWNVRMWEVNQDLEFLTHQGFQMLLIIFIFLLPFL
jgi:hypothetical protein